MDKYTIYCTKEQTKLAYKLGAKIKSAMMPLDIAISINKARIPLNNTDALILTPPTAEQMIGWLEEQKVIINIILTGVLDKGYNYELYYRNANHKIHNKNEFGQYMNREFATLAAIDAALEYLIDNKK